MLCKQETLLIAAEVRQRVRRCGVAVKVTADAEVAVGCTRVLPVDDTSHL